MFKMLKTKFIILFVSLCVLQSSWARIHRLKIQNDRRRYIALSTFGFYKGGILDVKLINFQPDPYKDDYKFGFSLDKTLSDAMNPYLDTHQDSCLLEDEEINQYPSGGVIFFIMDFKNLKLTVKCSEGLSYVHIYKNETELPLADRVIHSSSLISDSRLFQQRKRKREVAPVDDEEQQKQQRLPSSGISCSLVNLPIVKEIKQEKTYFTTNFVMSIATEAEEGLYNLYFHSCPNYRPETSVKLNFVMEIKENNLGNYLSAGEMPLPALYFMMALLFFLSGCFWVFILIKSKHPVYKIHYLMAVLVYLKALSLLFHGINYHFIQTKGEHVAAWAILYYITHLLKGSVLFIVIVLVGTGWTFIKHILSEKDKRIFMFVIPLQVLANVADIIIEESEEGDIEHRTWKDVFILVDLLCCGAILFPVVWSIRHLQEASQTDGKAAINLRKLKLFRHFYIMIVCYIYFTRIIVYLLKITVPFQYEWLDEMFREMATYAFFVLTGYKFRPASANPYFQLSAEDDEDRISVVITETGLTEGLKKVNRIENCINEDDEDYDPLLTKRESSHEYD